MGSSKKIVMHSTEKRKRTNLSSGKLLSIGGAPTPTPTEINAEVRALARKVTDAKCEAWMRRYNFDLNEGELKKSSLVSSSKLVDIRGKDHRPLR